MKVLSTENISQLSFTTHITYIAQLTLHNGFEAIKLFADQFIDGTIDNFTAASTQLNFLITLIINLYIPQ